MTPEVRRRDLDGLRGVAVLLTIVLHYISRSGTFAYLGPPPVARFLDSFWSGVDIFFVLSGFLIGGIILDNGRAKNFLKIFYLRRALRILPVAWLTIAVACLLSRRSFLSPIGRGRLRLMRISCSSIISGPRRVSTPIRRSDRCGHWRSKSSFICSRPRSFSSSIPGCETRPCSRSSSLPRSCACSHGDSPRGTSPSSASTVSPREFSSPFCREPQTSRSLPPEAWGVSLNSLAAASVILCVHANQDSVLSRALSRSWLVIAGRWSYFLYLMHVPMLMYVAASDLPKSLQPAAALGLCLLCAWASWRFLESRLIARGKALRYTPVADYRG